LTDYFCYYRDLLVADIDDADDADIECDKYDNCDAFGNGNYDAYTLAEIDRVEREAFAAGKYSSLSYAISFLICLPTAASVTRQLDTTSTASTAFNTPLATAALENAALEADSEHLAQANTSPLGATPQAGQATPDNIEDRAVKAEGASRSCYPLAVPYVFYIALIWFSNYCKLGPFFTCHAIFDADGDSDDDMESEDDGYIQVEDQGRGLRGDAKLSNAAAKLTRMSLFLTIPSKKPNNIQKYARLALQVFGDTIAPLIHRKEGQRYAKPDIFLGTTTPYSPSSFWIRPPEPVVSLSLHIFDPPMLYQPRVFLWLPHFFVTALRCPNCINGILEKNGNGISRETQ
jgi:hypothetical protein